jgi:hypothetical protein
MYRSIAYGRKLVVVTYLGGLRRNGAGWLSSRDTSWFSLLPENQKMRGSTAILHDVKYQLIYFKKPDFKQMLTYRPYDMDLETANFVYRQW